MVQRRNPHFHPARTLLTVGMLALVAVPLADAAPPKKKEPAQLDLSPSAASDPWKRYGSWAQDDWKQYNTLANLASPAYAAPPKLDGPITGDPKKGEKLAYDRGRGGSCVACHIMGKTTPALPGAVGPDLSTYSQWGRDDQWIFNYIYDPRSVNPESVMPPWGAHKVFTVDEIKDLVAFLKTLNAPPDIFKDPLENPATRPLPVEDRDNLDPFVNDAMASVERAQAAYARPGPSGKSCASCHQDPKKSFNTWAASMPKYETRLKKMLGVEEFVTRHTLATTGEKWLMQSKENLDMSAYMHFLANGSPIKVDLQSKEAKEALARGNELLKRKVGQLNFACLDCHGADRGANKWIRGQWLGEHKGQMDHFPLWRTSRGEVWDIRKRFQWCNVAVRSNELPPDAPEYGDVELALKVMNEGLKMSAPGIRH